jgi:hypothetical protein
MSAWRGSRIGTAGISVSPAPNRDAPLRGPRRRVGRLPATLRAEPSGTCPSRLVTVLTLADGALTPLDGAAPRPDGAAAPPVVPWAGAPAAGELAAAMPHTSQ